MKLVIGLGNPGKKYKNNRHNAGHMVVDKLSKTPNVKSFKTDTFMNKSGSFVKQSIDRYSLSIDDLVIIHDDLDLPLGIWKMHIGKGPKDHGGINDIEEKLDTKDFMRVRVGVDDRNPDIRIPGEEYVLQDFTNEERKILDKVIEEICKKLATL